MLSICYYKPPTLSFINKKRSVKKKDLAWYLRFNEDVLVAEEREVAVVVDHGQILGHVLLYCSTEHIQPCTSVLQHRT
jgi:hypothetical protein